MLGLNYSNRESICRRRVAADNLYFYACSETVVKLKRKHAIKPHINSGFVLSTTLLATASLPHSLARSVGTRGLATNGEKRRGQDLPNPVRRPPAFMIVPTDREPRTGFVRQNENARDLISKQARRSLNSSHNRSSDRWQEWEERELRDKPSERL